MEPRQVLSADEIDLSSAEFWARPIEERDGAFLTLRKEQPISFHSEPQVKAPRLPQGPGYWSLTRHADVVHASRAPEVFCSGQGSNIGDLPRPFLESFGSMINTDDPRHGHLRRIDRRRVVGSLHVDHSASADGKQPSRDAGLDFLGILTTQPQERLLHRILRTLPVTSKHPRRIRQQRSLVPVYESLDRFSRPGRCGLGHRRFWQRRRTRFTSVNEVNRTLLGENRKNRTR